MSTAASDAPPLGPYDRGATTFYACRRDQRFAYCLYVPRSYDERRGSSRPLLVVVHGSGRVAESYRNAMRAFADEHDVIVLAPLFPCGVGDPLDQSGYKFLRLDDIRFDLVLLAMVDEVRAGYRIGPERFLLFGFSGGAQFAHRFFYCHPRRLLALSAGAPGVVTLLDERRDWWVGVRGLERAMGCPLELAALREVPVHLVIGALDLDTAEIHMRPPHRFYLEGINDAGEDRPARLRALDESLRRAGIATRFEVVAGVAHDGFAVIPQVTAFFAEVLRTWTPSR